MPDVYKNTARDEMPMDETVTGYVDRVYRIAKRVIVEGGGTAHEVDGKTVYSIRSETPGNVEPLPATLERVDELKRELLPGIEKDLTGSPIDRAQARISRFAWGSAAAGERSAGRVGGGGSGVEESSGADQQGVWRAAISGDGVSGALCGGGV